MHIWREPSIRLRRNCYITHTKVLRIIQNCINPFMPTGAFNICCPRDAVSRTANVERTGRHKWVNVQFFIRPVWNACNFRVVFSIQFEFIVIFLFSLNFMLFSLFSLIFVCFSLLSLNFMWFFFSVWISCNFLYSVWISCAFLYSVWIWCDFLYSVWIW